MTGLHLLIDGKAATQPASEALGRFVTSCAEQIGLHIIGGPFFFELEHYRVVWAIIAESHISVKAFREGMVLIDVFSCKSFSTADAALLAQSELGLEQWTDRVIRRMGTGS